MALTKKTTDKTGLGRLTVYMKKGNKTIESTWCAKADAVKAYLDIQQINGLETELVRVLYNGKQIYPEKTMDTKELSDYLPKNPKPQTIRTWVRKGQIPYHKQGTAKNSPTYFIVSEIDKWLQNGRK